MRPAVSSFTAEQYSQKVRTAAAALEELYAWLHRYPASRQGVTRALDDALMNHGGRRVRNALAVALEASKPWDDEDAAEERRAREAWERSTARVAAAEAQEATTTTS